MTISIRIEIYTHINTFPKVLCLYLTLTIIIRTQAASSDSPAILTKNEDRVSRLLELVFDEVSPKMPEIAVKTVGITNIHTSEIIQRIVAVCLSSGDIIFSPFG